MAPNPTTDGALVAVEEGNMKEKKFLCIFSDKSEVTKQHKFHFSLNGSCTTETLYQTVADKQSYVEGTFLLGFMEFGDYGTEIEIDPQSSKTLAEHLTGSTSKKNQFSVMQKNGKDPELRNGATTVAVQSTHEPENYEHVGTLFSSNEQKDGNESYQNNTISSGYSYSGSSYNSYANVAGISLKSLTGYVGLVNQAMTCYLNSLLQTLFMTPEFRNALYRLRIKQDLKDESVSIPYQLQKLFIQLETSNKRAVETTGLTKSFGWESGEAWQQHDVQELCRVMFDKLEETLKGTHQENLINQLYQGEMKDYVKCLHCNHESSRKDNYLDISVDIRPFGSKVPYKNLEEALEAFVTPETLSGNNQYHCEQCDAKQDAHKGLKFVNFPYLLTIQLKRFTFDFNTLQRTKLPDKLTFSFTMDLSSLVKDKGEAEESPARPPASDEKIDINKMKERNQENETNNPYLYELFSILIHSGSAAGGHYYAYIKSFEDDKWYCFNDQYVSEISQDDVQKSYGGDGMTSGYTSTYSSSTNAYMLMYRRLDRKENRGFTQQSDWSASLKDLCSDILNDENKEKNRKEWERNVCKLKLYAIHPVTKAKLDSKLEIHKDSTWKEATVTAWKLLQMEKVIPLEQCRLVKYDDYNESFEMSYQNSDDKTVLEILGQVRQTYTFDLLLEWRGKDEEFKTYLPGGTTLKVYMVDLEECGFDEPRVLHVPLSITFAELKEILEKETGLSAEQMRVAYYKEVNGYYLFEKETRTLKSEGFYKSGKIFIEGLSEEDREVPFKESKFLQRLEVFSNSINVKIFLPATENDTPDDKKNDADQKEKTKELSLLIDKRITLKELKDIISKKIGLDPHYFRVFRLYSNSQEYECTRLDDQLHSYSDGTQIIVKHGRALYPGETRVKFFHLLPNEKEHSKYLLDGIVKKGMTIQELKEEQIFAQLEKEQITFVRERVRIRKKSYKNPANIYPDHFKFEEDFVLSYSAELFLELLDHDEEVVNNDYISIYMRRWNCEAVSIDPFEEAVLLINDASVENLKKKIEEKSGIPVDSVQIAKGRGMFPCTCSVLDIQHELDWNPISNRITDYPLSMKEDGGVIYYKDAREKPKKLSDEERKEIRSKERETSGHTVTKIYRKEKALKIYTNGDKR
ncbi:ubiquitin carboxyl-terminal hydrolase 47-like [Clytia hemisphaerica]|uniref:Ubiquitin carboxyl-terminal hydrolase 47 n=1 Tax=Clytia hemisphaerica TaxID=252671 RepID=A0A7M5VDI4_9CNID